MVTGIDTDVSTDAAREFVRELVRVVRSHRLYEGSHPTLVGMYSQLCRKCNAAAGLGMLTIRFNGQRVLVGDEVLHVATSATEVVPSALYDHGIVAMEFEGGMSEPEARSLITALAIEPDATNDYASLLWEADLRHVRILLDSDEVEEDVPVTPQQFARELTTLGDDDDPPSQNEYGNERDSLGRHDIEEAPELSVDRFDLSDSDHWQMSALLAGDGFLATVRHTASMLHNMANEEMDPEGLETVDRAFAMVARALCLGGDLEGALETIRRGAQMAALHDEQRAHVGRRTIDAFRDPESVVRMLRGLDKRNCVDAEPLETLLTQIGPVAASPVAAWLQSTPHLDAAARAMRTFGDAAALALLPLYRDASAEARSRMAPALLHAGTQDALFVLAPDFDRLDASQRQKFVRLAEGSDRPELRHVIVSALEDSSGKVRHTAILAVRRPDAPRLAAVLKARLDRGDLDHSHPEERDAFFDMLARAGDGAVATTLAAYATPKRFSLAGRKLSDLQLRCLRALRRMRSADARAVVEELRAHGPRQVRDALDNPLADLET